VTGDGAVGAVAVVSRLSERAGRTVLTAAGRISRALALGPAAGESAAI
jgi:hypothetical protein